MWSAYLVSMTFRRQPPNQPLEWTGLHLFYAFNVKSLPATQGQRYPYPASR